MPGTGAGSVADLADAVRSGRLDEARWIAPRAVY